MDHPIKIAFSLLIVTAIIAFIMADNKKWGDFWRNVMMISGAVALIVLVWSLP